MHAHAPTHSPRLLSLSLSLSLSHPDVFIFIFSDNVQNIAKVSFGKTRSQIITHSLSHHYEEANKTTIQKAGTTVMMETTCRRRKKKSRNWPPVPSSTRWLVEPPSHKAGKKGLCRLSRVVTLSLRSCAVCYHCRYDTLLLSPLLQYYVSPQLGGR